MQLILRLIIRLRYNFILHAAKFNSEKHCTSTCNAALTVTTRELPYFIIVQQNENVSDSYSGGTKFESQQSVLTDVFRYFSQTFLTRTVN